MAGIPHTAVDFFAELEDNNNRDWWTANKADYQTTVRTPFEQLLEQVDETLEWRIYRPHRDTRFAKDKTPYKTFIGAVTQRPSGNGHFIQISRRGLLIGSGYPMMAKDQLERFRAALDQNGLGNQFLGAVRTTREQQIEVTPGRYPPLTTAPRGYTKDHPRIEWLRAKGVEIPQHLGSPTWLSTPKASAEIRERLMVGHAVVDWLNQHVGASHLTPEEIWGR